MDMRAADRIIRRSSSGIVSVANGCNRCLNRSSSVVLMPVPARPNRFG
jgi:hypothetical protein